MQPSMGLMARPTRYQVVQVYDSSLWGIMDMWLMGYCALPDNPPPGCAPNMIPLEWHTPAAAEAWMTACRRLWASGAVPAPAGWEQIW